MSLPRDYFRIKLVGSLEELAAVSFVDGVNAFCWKRLLDGDFSEVVEQLSADQGITPIDPCVFERLALSSAGRKAVRMILDDLRMLEDLGRDPVANLIDGYPRDEDPGPVATDVFSFHADSAPVEADTWLCTYHGASSEGLRNDEAVKKVEVPSIREKLLQMHGGEDDAEFLEFLEEGYYDLHYQALAGARPFQFGLGNMWRIAVDWPGSQVPPCVHRAPLTVPGDPLRLMVIC